jgi:hypothetical protein
LSAWAMSIDFGSGLASASIWPTVCQPR